MLTYLTRGRLKRTLDIVEDAETIHAATLEVSITVVGNNDNLFRGSNLFDDLIVSPVENLNVSLIECDNNKSVVAKSIEYLKLARQFVS